MARDLYEPREKARLLVLCHLEHMELLCGKLVRAARLRIEMILSRRTTEDLSRFGHLETSCV